MRWQSHLFSGSAQAWALSSSGPLPWSAGAFDRGDGSRRSHSRRSSHSKRMLSTSAAAWTQRKGGKGMFLSDLRAERGREVSQRSRERTSSSSVPPSPHALREDPSEVTDPSAPRTSSQPEQTRMDSMIFSSLNASLVLRKASPCSLSPVGVRILPAGHSRPLQEPLEVRIWSHGREFMAG